MVWATADMRRLRRRDGRHGKTRGFTLIELMVVLAILAILISMALARYLSVSKKAFKSEADNVLQEAKSLEWSYYQQFSAFDTSGTNIGLAVPTGMHWQSPTFSLTGTAIDILMTGGSGSSTAPIGTADSVWVTLGTDGSSAGGSSF